MRLKFILLFLFGLFIASTCFGINGRPNLRRACKSQNDSDIVIRWSQPADTCNSFIKTYIFGRKDNTQPFGLIDSVGVFTQNTYTHIQAFLQSNKWEYFIVIENDCSGNPTIASDTLAIDLTQPAFQEIDSVSYDFSSNKYIIGWKPSPSLDIMGYVLYDFVSGNNIIKASLSNISNSYVDPVSNPGSITLSYSLAAYDSCNNITAICSPHTPILAKVAFDTCNETFIINWNNYVGWNNVDYQQLFVSINSGGLIPIQLLPGTSKTTSIKINSLVSGDNVCFVVRAYKGGDTTVTSSSNPACILYQPVDKPRINYLANVTVPDNSRIQIKWLSESGLSLKEFWIQKSFDSMVFFTIYSEPYVSTINTYGYFDNNVDVQKNKYFYRVVVINRCGVPCDTSNICNNILLTGSALSVSKNMVSWNPYYQFDIGVDHYELHRGTGSIANGYSLSTLSGNANNPFYDDNLPEQIDNDGICYQVLAFENTSNQYGLAEVSKSNRFCIAGEMKVYFPNAFKPSGINSIFKPVGIYLDYSDCELEIFNSWGQLVFKTNDMQKGWNGEDDSGTPLQEGIFIYLARIKSISGKIEYANGTVLLLR